MANNTNNKIIVAIHGVGDQFRYATSQSVITRFSAHIDHLSSVPLGSFYAELNTPDQREPLRIGELAFTEVYWADIPDKIAQDGHTLEEPQSWARTIVDRLQLRSKAEMLALDEEIEDLKREREKHEAMKNFSAAAESLSRLEGKWQVKDACSASGLEQADYFMLKQVLDEMIQTIAILERISLLADRAGIFKFNLKNLLDCYLGDVQIVTEFREQRRKILDEFKLVMAEAHRFDPEAEIYIVAHSEGTVISFLGLLEALSAVQRPEWVSHVRGLMTLGSPIDKHLILWPDELWRKFETPRPGLITNPGVTLPPDPLAEPIRWYNYYDFGDPIGYDLNETRHWLHATGWDKLFDFRKENDIGFWRYPLPGKAHVDYWKDEEVFCHFIENVVLRRPTSTTDSSEKPSATEQNKKTASGNRPRSKTWPLLTSYIFPYVGVGAILFAAVFILYKALHTCLDPKISPSNIEIFRNVFGMTLLLYGVTVTARIPRLTRVWYWRLLGPALYLFSGALYFKILEDGKAGDFGIWLENNFGVYRPGFSRFLVTLAVLILVALIGAFGKSRTYGFKPLIGLGGIAITALLAFQLIYDKGDRGPVWPLIMAALGFMYLWWLGALIFDLIFVWHHYIRWSVALKRMCKIVASHQAREEWTKAATRKSKHSHVHKMKAKAAGA